MEKSRTDYSLVNISTGLAGYAVNTLVGFVCRIIFVRCLNAEYLGISGLFSNILTMLSLAEMGIGSAILYALYKPIADNDKDKIASLMQFYKRAYRLIGVIVTIIGLAMLPFLNLIIQEPPSIKENLYFIYLLYLISSVSGYFIGYQGSLLTAMQRNYLVVGYNYIITIAQSILQIIFLLLTHEYITYLLIQIVGGFLYEAWIAHKANKDHPYIKGKNIAPISKNETKTMFVDIKALSIGKIAEVLVNNTDNIVITYFSGLISVGYASNYVTLSATLNTIIKQSFNALTGSVGNLNATADAEKRYSFFKALNLTTFWLYGWATIGMIFVSSDLVQLFYGSEYLMDIKIPIILAINFYMVGMQQSVYTYKYTMGLFKQSQYVTLFTAALNLILDVILGQTLGIFGIYLATAIARLFTNTWFEPYAVYKYGLKVPPIKYFAHYILYAAILLVTSLLCGFVCSFVNYSAAINVAFKVIICSVIPNAVFAICFSRTEEFHYLYGKVTSILKRLLKRG